jgi:hypothetical protein
LANKIREGLAKGVESARIELVVRQIALHLEMADRLIRELQPSGGAGREAVVSLLAESFGSGVTTDEVRLLYREAQTPGAPSSLEQVAGAAKGLAFIKEAKLPVADGTAVIAEAVRHRFRSHEILDIGRDVKRREADYRSGRSSLRALQDAIARGDRLDQLFSAARADAIDRPAAARPEAPVDRPDRPGRPEPAPRPEQPERPAPIDRPVRGG